MTPAALGVFIGSITVGFVAGAFIAGRLAARNRPTTMMMAGRLIACCGLGLGITLSWAGHASPLVFFGSTIFVGLGNGITMPSSNAAAMSVRADLTGSAAGINGALIVAGGAVLTSVTGAALSDHNPALTLLILMLAASAAGLLALFIAPSRARV
ncbi:MAG: hypothetical protein AAFP85_05430 [Pseudomonadota bacterium]